MAGFYRRGDVVEKDVAKSIELVQQAAELGEAQAMRDLAFIYENALGVDADEAKAKYLARQEQMPQNKNKTKAHPLMGFFTDLKTYAQK